ncbi:putative N-acetyltransferase 9-like protein [Nannochloris sp. 'desiccata']|nr:hypothetical protein KSW81_002612 [Chlorella desiccata (nom. nud.)]KAH7617364.1 putative N-acetyltransferase 9-like protein [Chlorella desiccata (nom. nud.)]
MRANSNLTLHGERVILKDPALLEATASEPLSIEEEYGMQVSWAEDEANTEGTGTHGGGMAGDVNLYWNDHDDPNTAEIEIMVAEQRSRRKGIAREVLTLLMTYALSQLKVTTFRAKIGDDNIPSQSLFKSLGYEQVNRSEVFKEVTLELSGNSGGQPGAKAVWDALSELALSLRMGKYDP